MELPEQVKNLIEELGNSLMMALSEDERCKAITLDIQNQGYELVMLLEATVALTKTKGGSTIEIEAKEKTTRRRRHKVKQNLYDSSESDSTSWTEADRSFLRAFHIKPD